MGDSAKEAAIKLGASLRKQGVGLIQAMGNKSLKAQLRQANTLGIRYTVIIGEEEVTAGTVQLRDMSTSQQQTINLTELEKAIQKLKANG